MATAVMILTSPRLIPYPDDDHCMDVQRVAELPKQNVSMTDADRVPMNKE